MKTKTKLIIGGVVAVVVIGSTIYAALTDNKEPAVPVTQVTQSQTPTANQDPTPMPTEPAEPTADPEAVKQNAIAADVDLWLIVQAIDRTSNKLIETMKAADNSATYKEAEEAIDTFMKFREQAGNVECDGVTDYSREVQGYAVASMEIPKAVIKYIDSEERKHLSDTEDAIQNLPMFGQLVTDARTKFLEDSGLTDEEIKEIYEKP